MSTHKDIIKKYLDGVHDGDKDLVLSLVTDDVLLEKKGQPAMRGKAVLSAVMDNQDGIVSKEAGAAPRPVHKVERMIEEGDTVVVNGTAIVALPTGGQLEFLFSDYFVFKGDLISGIESFFIPANAPQPQPQG